MNQNTVRLLVMAVPLLIWLGVFAYLMMIDRSLRRLERRLERHEEGQETL